MTSTTTINILLSNMSDVEKALLAISKRYKRKGFAPIEWTWGKAFTHKQVIEEGGRHVDIARIPLTVPYELPHHDGWTFVATLEHIDNVNITYVVRGETLPPEYRDCGPSCQHCNMNRRRKDTYILRHDDGRLCQVGSTCLVDFLGCTDAMKLALAASMIVEIDQACSDGGYGDRGKVHALSIYLEYVAWSIRLKGWMSRTASKDRDGQATADHVYEILAKPETRDAAQAEINQDDRDLAAAALAWVESLQEGDITSDYLYNLWAVSQRGFVNDRHMGLAASMIAAYQNHLAGERKKEIAKSQIHVGQIGSRETFEAQLDFLTHYDTQFGTITLVKFLTDDGAALVWKASGYPGLTRDDMGKRCKIVGRVKAHEEYKDEKQTILTRCKVELMEAAAAA